MTDKGTVFLSSLNIKLKNQNKTKSKTATKNKNEISMGNLKKKNHPGEDKGSLENTKDTLSRAVRCFPI